MNGRLPRILCCLTLLLLHAGRSHGDIYRLVEDDVVVFTDTPANRRYELVVKERRAAVPTPPGSKVPRHLASLNLPAISPAGTDAASGSGASNELPVLGRITSVTGLRHDPFDGKLRHHNGVDIAVPAGTPVKPVADGQVVFSGARTGYGNLVVIDHRDGTLTLYAHNSSNLVAQGTQVTRNTVIALTGSTGRSTGPHLHFEAWQDGSNVTASYVPASTVSPATWKDAVETPVQRVLQPDGTILFTNLR